MYSSSASQKSWPAVHRSPGESSQATVSGPARSVSSPRNARQRTESQAQQLRVLTGRVGKVRDWMGLVLPCPVLYRVHGVLGAEVAGSLNSKETSRTKVFELCDEDGQKIVCRYMEIDRDIGSLKSGEPVVVVGRGLPDGSLQAVSVESCVPVASHLLSRLENFAVKGVRLVLKQKEAEEGTGVRLG